MDVEGGQGVCLTNFHCRWKAIHSWLLSLLDSGLGASGDTDSGPGTQES